MSKKRVVQDIIVEGPKKVYNNLISRLFRLKDDGYEYFILREKVPNSIIAIVKKKEVREERAPDNVVSFSFECKNQHVCNSSKFVMGAMFERYGYAATEKVVHSTENGYDCNAPVLTIDSSNPREDVSVLLDAIFNFFAENDWRNEHSFEAIKVANTVTKTPFPLNRIEISDKTMEKFSLKENDYVNLINPMNGHLKKCVVKTRIDMDENTIALTKSIKTGLGILDYENENILIQKSRKIIQTKMIVLQSVDDISANIIRVSNDIYEKLHGKDRMFEVKNDHTGASFDIDRENILPSNTGANTISLSFLQRQLIDLELPILLEPNILQNLCEHIESENDRSHLMRIYGNDKIIGDMSFQEKERIRGILKQAGYYSVSLYPIEEVRAREETMRERFKGYWERCLRFLIDYNTARLKCIRPYASDEISNVVRLTTTMIKMLGIDNTDNVILEYRGKEIKARVLEIPTDAFENMKATNTLSSMAELEYSIGIPAHIRNKLGMKFINNVCTVRRDTNYIFKKYAHLQIVPTIGIFFTVYQIVKDPLWRGIITISALLISLYVNFMTERNKISS